MSQPDKHLRIASYNIRKAKGLDGRRDPMRVLSVINQLGADVIALQEADRRLGDRPTVLHPDVISRETDFEAIPVAENNVSLGWHGNAVLIKKGMAHGKVTRITLPGLEPRGAVRIDLPDVTIVATHLGLLRRHRLAQLREITGNLNDCPRAIVVGDFNEWSKRKGLGPLTARYAVYTPGHSFHAARPIASLDRIAVSSDVVIKDAGVVQTPKTKVASDHLPIWADITTTSR